MSSKPLRSKSRRERSARFWIYVLLIAMSAIWLIPFFYLILQAFRGETTAMVGYIWPRQWSLINFQKLFTETNFFKWYGNTLIVALFSAVLQTIIVLSVAYALSRMRFKGRRFLMNLILVLGMFPGFMAMIAVYFILKLFGFTQAGAIPGMILVYVGSSGMGYYIAKGFFDTIPRSLDEAARIDGASRMRVFFSIVMPMAKPITIYTVMMAFIAPWGDFMYASLIAFGYEKSYNVAVGLFNFLQKEQINNRFTLFCAGGVLVAIPITALFMMLQRYYVEGVTGGAVKG